MGEVWQCFRFEAPGSYSKFCILSGFYGVTVSGRALNIHHDTTNRLSHELQRKSEAPPRIKPILGPCCEGAFANLLISRFLGR